MPIPEVLEHWIPVPLLALGFWWLLKRSFNDFEGKLASLFKTMENTLKEQQSHDTRLQLITQRVENLEAKRRR